MTFLQDLFPHKGRRDIKLKEPSGSILARRIQRFAGEIRSQTPLPELIVTLNGVKQPIEVDECQGDTWRPFVVAWSCWAEIANEANAPKSVVLDVMIGGESACRRKFRCAPLDDRLDTPLVLLQHIPKTAGTSLRAALEQHADLRMLGVYPDVAFMKPHEAGFLGRSAFDDLDLIFGHFCYGLHSHTRRAYRYATILRHPADLIRSYYLFMKYQTGAYAHYSSLEQAFSSNLHAFDNPLTRYISGLSPGERIGRDVADAACDNLTKDYAYVGFTENMPASLRVIGNLFGIELADYTLNVTPESAEAAELSRPCIMDRFAPFLTYDLEIYALSNLMFAGGNVNSATLN